VKTLIDATFANTFYQRHGSSAAIWFSIPRQNISAGHNDLSRARCSDQPELVDGIRSLQAVTGAIVDPFVAYLLVRGLKTFSIRIARRMPTRKRREFLAAHPRVSVVHYAGLPTHPQIRLRAPDARIWRVVRSRLPVTSRLRPGR